MEEEERTDLVVIGGGVAGITAAIRSAQRGLKAILVEKDRIGGVHVNYGGIATKALISAVELFKRVRDGSRLGIDGTVSLDWGKMQKHKEKVCSQICKFNEMALSRNGVRILYGAAALLSPTKVKISLKNGGERVIEAKNILIAVGSRASTIPGVPLEGAILDSERALGLEKPPKSLLIIGGGAVGLEFATIFCLLGSKVTVVELLQTLLPGEEPEVGEFVANNLQREGVEVLVGRKVTEVKPIQDGVRAKIDTPAGERIVTVENVLMAVGRRPNIDLEGLETVGVKTDRRGIIVNEKMQTSVPNIYAAGDVVGRHLLVNVAMKEAKVAASNLTGKDETMQYSVIPRCVFTMPEVASVGLTESQARDKGLDVKTVRSSFFNPRAAAVGEVEGFIKIITTRHEKIVGATIVGADASDLIFEFSLAIAKEIGALEMGGMMYPSPSFSEAIMNTLERIGEEAIFGFT